MNKLLSSPILHSSRIDVINYIYSILTLTNSHTVCYLQDGNSIIPYVNMPSLFYTNQTWNVTLDTVLLAFIERGCSTFIVDHSYALPFLDSFIGAHDKALFCNSRKTVIFTDLEPELLKDIQQHSAYREMFDVEVISVNHLSTEEMLIWKPSKGRRDATNFNADYGAYLNGRILRLTTFEEMPIIKLVSDRSGNVHYDDDWYIIDGLDGIVVTGFCKRYNCTWELELIDQTIQYGQLYPNGSGDGMIGALLERRVDVAIAGVSVWHHLFPYFSFSATLQRVGINCLTPRPKMLPSWITLIKAFSDTVWVVFVLCLVCYSYILHLVLKRREPFMAIQQVFAAFLLQATKFQNRSLSETIFSVAILLASINMTFIYLGKEASMRNFPQMSASIETIDDLAKSGLHWNAPHDAWKYSLLTSDHPSILKLLETFRALPLAELLEEANKGAENFAFVRLHYGHYMFGDYITEENVHLYRPMSEDIYWEHETVWTTKTWPFLEPFNQHILQSWGAGLPQYEELIMVRRYLNYKVQLEIENSRNHRQRQLKALRFDDVFGILVLLLLGLGLSTITFILELIFLNLS